MMEKSLHKQPLQFQHNEMLANKKKELLKDLNSDYAGYKENFGNDIKKIVAHFKKYGIKTANLKLLMDIRSRMSGTKIHAGIGFGPLVGVLP